jgi:nitroreductase
VVSSMSEVWSQKAQVAQIRVARPTNQLQKGVAFYRDGIGLPVIGHFANHNGYGGVMLARKNMRYDSSDVIDHLKNVKKMLDEVIDRDSGRYRSFQESDMHLFESERAMFDWSSKQTYIALGNMMTAAALICIDSCPKEDLIIMLSIGFLVRMVSWRMDS